MERSDPNESDPNETDDEKIARALAGVSESPSAIERQIAAVSALRYDDETYGEAGRRRHAPDYNTHRHKPRRSGLKILLVLMLLAAAGWAWVFTDIGRQLRQAVGAVLPAPQQTAAIRDPSPPIDTAPIDEPPPPAADLPAVSQPQTVAPQEGAAAAAETAAALSVPIADVSVRNRPELLEQLVQVYRSQLANDSNDATALAALDQLRERSLSELQTIITAGDDSATVRSLALVTRLFPELADNQQYKYLIARMDYIHRQPKGEQTAPAEQSAALTAAVSAPPVLPATAAPAATATATAAPVTASPPTVSPANASANPAAASPSTRVSNSSAAAAAKKTSENTSSLEPEIREISVTPGTMAAGHFVPGNGGNAFMVELSYRNFERAFIGKAETTLTALLGVPDDPLVLAEVPVTITADRGTKSFVMETANVEGYAGGKFQLNFILNDELLTSRTLRLSKPVR